LKIGPKVINVVAVCVICDSKCEPFCFAVVVSFYYFSIF